MLGTYVKMEQFFETLETLADEDALKIIEKGIEQVAKDEFVECSIKQLGKSLEVKCLTRPSFQRSFS